MDNPLIVVNDSVSIVDMFTFKCNACDTTFDMESVDQECPHCKALLFERMRKPAFANLFADSLTALGVPRKAAVKFVNDGSIPVADLNVCTEMSTLIDLNFQLKFGGQFKSFFIKESFDTIKVNNFNKYSD